MGRQLAAAKINRFFFHKANSVREIIWGIHFIVCGIPIQAMRILMRYVFVVASIASGTTH